MSTKELAYSLIDCMSEEQLENFVAFMRSFTELPNEETLEAIKEVEKMKKNPDEYKSYDDVDVMFKELLS
ncbi:MAG: hypothetical protein J6C96_03800 [Oscillospiraceae bacterium]|nr:hypothetical protein [Oscillospiraceae bacterium]